MSNYKRNLWLSLAMTLVLPIACATPSLASGQASGVTIAPDEAAYPLVVGESHEIAIAMLTPGSGSESVLPGTKGLTFVSSRPQVVAVSSDGTATALKVGNAVVTASYQGHMTQVVIAVQPPVQSGVHTSLQSQAGHWHLVWDEEFKGPVGDAPDPARWTYDIGNNNGWGNNEEEYYTASTHNAYLNGKGDLVLQANKQSINGYAYSSARLVSKGTGNWRYGYIAVDAKLPKGGQGIWPAIWMLPTNWTYGGWPTSGEVDIMEAVNSMSTIYGTLHYGWDGSNQQDGQPYPSSLDAGYHVFAVKWSPTRFRFYVDSHLYLTVASDQWTALGNQTAAPFDQPFHLMLNIANGGNWPGAVSASTPYPQQMLVHWVRVYQRSSAYAWPVPGRIQADRFTLGSEHLQQGPTNDIAYSASATPAASSNLSLVLDHKVTLTAPGAKADYRIQVGQSGRYTVDLRVKTLRPVHVQCLVDGKRITVATVPNTHGTWVTWRLVTSALTQGDHTLAVVALTPGLQLHWLTIAQ